MPDRLTKAIEKNLPTLVMGAAAVATLGCICILILLAADPANWDSEE